MDKVRMVKEAYITTMQGSVKGFRAGATLAGEFLGDPSLTDSERAELQQLHNWGCDSADRVNKECREMGKEPLESTSIN